MVAVTKVTQAMSPNITSGTILSKIFWRAVTAGEPAVDGRFEVSSSYMMNSKGVLEVRSAIKLPENVGDDVLI